MSDSDALRILGLGPDADDNDVRRAFARQLRELREARAATEDAERRERLDRALDLTFRASRQLLDTTREFAVTRELPAVRTRADRRIVAASIVGGILILLGLLLPPESGPGDQAATAPETERQPEGQLERVTLQIPPRRPVDPPREPEPASPVLPERAWFDPLRAALAGRWRTDGGWSLPSRTEPAGLPAGPWSPDWQLLGQNHGGIALVRGDDWLLAMPALMDGRLRWGCFSTLALDGCRRLEGNENFRRDLVAGEVGPGRLARLLEQAGPAAAADADDWHRQALDRGNGESGMHLGAQVSAETAREELDDHRRARALHWYQRAATAFTAQSGAVLAQSRALEAMALLVATDPAANPPRAARHLLDCRRLREELEATPCIRPDEIGARLELANMYLSGNGVEADAGRAARMYAELLEHAPRLAGSMLAWIRATHPDPALRDGEQAVRIARNLVEQPAASGPSLADLHDTLAAALAEAGDPAVAVTAQRRALTLLEQEATPGLAGFDIAERRAGQQRRLAAYRSGRPWRDPDFTARNTG